MVERIKKELDIFMVLFNKCIDKNLSLADMGKIFSTEFTDVTFEWHDGYLISYINLTYRVRYAMMFGIIEITDMTTNEFWQFVDDDQQNDFTECTEQFVDMIRKYPDFVKRIYKGNI